MTAAPQRIAVLGATGRIGREVVAQAEALGLSVQGLARNRPPRPARFASFVVGDRADAHAVARAIEGADAVIDLCAFDRGDADALLAAWELVASAPARWVFASSMAERAVASWAAHPADFAALDAEPAPDDAYGAGKRRVRQRVTEGLRPRGVGIAALLLPQVWDAAALSDDHVRRGDDGSGAASEGRPCVVTAATAAAALLGLAVDGRDLSGPWQLAPTVRPDRARLLAATGGVDVFSGGDEPVDGAPLRDALPALPWPELPAVIAANRREG